MTGRNNPSAMAMEIDIVIECPAWEEALPDLDTLVRETLERAVSSAFCHLLDPRSSSPAPQGRGDDIRTAVEISIVLADDAFVQDLNKRYRHKDKPTNVLSFPQTEIEDLDAPQPFLSLGDIIIAYETITREAGEQGKPLADHFRHMLVHGCLHLLHFDHIEEDEAQAMESLEIAILGSFGVKNPYQDAL